MLFLYAVSQIPPTRLHRDPQRVNNIQRHDPSHPTTSNPESPSVTSMMYLTIIEYSVKEEDPK